MDNSEENSDIDDTLKLLSSFESKCQDMVLENIQLQEQLTISSQTQLDSKQQLEMKKREIIHLRESIDVVQSSLGDHLQQQEENLKLKRLVEEFKKKAEEEQSFYEEKKKILRADLEELERKHVLEIEQVREDQFSILSNLNNGIDVQIDTKNKRIRELEVQLEDADKEKKEEITKLKLENEARLMKAMRQNSSYHNQPVSGINNAQEIYKRKLDHIQQIHIREVCNLKQKINELQVRLNTKHHTKLY